jgi:hypothetical protein
MIDGDIDLPVASCRLMAHETRHILSAFVLQLQLTGHIAGIKAGICFPPHRYDTVALVVSA